MKKLHLQREIEGLKKRILRLGAEVEEAVTMAIKALKEGDVNLARKVIDYDVEIDRMEVETEEECLKILALHQPVAIDLRFVVAVLKINNDLERIADLAANMAKRAFHLGKEQRIEIPDLLLAMVEKAESMQVRSLDALVNLNPELAREVIEDDDIVDNLHRQMYTYVKEAILDDSEDVDAQINLLSISRQVERIADSVTNIAEDIIYMVEGEIVRHQGKI